MGDIPLIYRRPMPGKRILSASVRTDIPMDQPQQLIKPLENGHFFDLGENVSTDMNDIYGAIYWTKDFKDLMPYMDGTKPITVYKDGKQIRLNSLLDYAPTVVSYTLNNYPKSMESNLRSYEQRKNALLTIARLIKEHASSPNNEGVTVRFDPIPFILSPDSTEDAPFIDENTKILSPDWTLNTINNTLDDLSDGANSVVNRAKFSFIDRNDFSKDWQTMNRFTGGRRNYRDVLYKGEPVRQYFVDRLADIIHDHGLHFLDTCAETTNGKGITHSGCVNADLWNSLYGPDTIPTGIGGVGKRANCACLDNRDPGRKQTCHGGCYYCYSTDNCHDKSGKYRADIAPIDVNTAWNNNTMPIKNMDEFDKWMKQFDEAIDEQSELHPDIITPKKG